MIASFLGALVIGCTSLDPRVACQEQAGHYGPDFVVVGAFRTTVGTIRAMTPGVEPPRWPELGPESQAVVCYIDGPIGKGPPPPARSFDRALIGIAGTHTDMIIAGYRESLVIQRP